MDSSMVIVPVGFDLGPVYTGDGPASRAPTHYEVHFGGEPEELTATEYAVWSAAFADPDPHLDLKVDRNRLAEFVRVQGHPPVGQVPDAGPVMDGLLERGLLLEFDPAAGAALAEPFDVHRLHPRALGLGSTVQLPELYGIGYADSRFAEVPANVYQIWSFGVGTPTLWEACAQFAESADVDLPPGEQPLNLAAEEVAGQVAENLPLLLSTGAAFLDPLNYEPSLPTAPVPLPAPAAQPPTAGRPPVLVPLGMSLGWDYWAGPPEERPDQYYQVHLGGDYVDLTQPEFTAWTAAFRDLQWHARHAVTRTTLTEGLRRAGMPDAAAVVAGLLQRGLLAEFEPAEGSLEELFRAVQLYPLGTGFGNAPEDPDQFLMGVEDERLVAVNPVVYTVWSYSLTAGSLWEACTVFADATNDAAADAGETADLSADEFARGVASALPAMIAAGCAYLDPLSYAA